MKKTRKLAQNKHSCKQTIDVLVSHDSFKLFTAKDSHFCRFFDNAENLQRMVEGNDSKITCVFLKVQKKIITLESANMVDPYEVAHNKPPNFDLHCLLNSKQDTA